MAFESQNFFLDRGSYNSGSVSGSPAVHKYGSIVDNLAGVLASGYFDELAPTTTGTAQEPPIRLGDLIYINSTDDQQFARITSVVVPITVTQFSETVDDGSITTAKLADLAVTTPKLANDAVTTPKLANDAVTNDKLAPTSIDAKNVTIATDGNIIGVIPFTYQIVMPGGATNQRDIIVTFNTSVIDVWVLNVSGGTAGDTITVQNTAAVISGPLDVTTAPNTVVDGRGVPFINANSIIPASGTLRVVQTDGGGNDSPQVIVFVQALKST